MHGREENSFEFGEFRLDAEEKVLRKGDSIALITPKAFDILLVLVQNAGSIVSKEEVFRQVWADSFVEEANLSHHIFRLRKVLGETDERKFIETIPKRGYRFVADVVERSRPDAPSRAGPPVYAMAPGLRMRNHWIYPVAILLVVLSAFAFAWFRSGTGVGKGIKNTNSNTQHPLTITRLTNSGKVGAVAISPDGKFVAYQQNYEAGEGMLYIRQIESNTERKLLAPSRRNFGSIAFSPDGTFIFYIAYEENDPEGALYRIAVNGGQAVRVLDNVKFMFTLSPDGTRAAFYRFDAEHKQTRIVHAALNGSNDEVTVATFNDGEKVITSVPAFSPDGRLISFGLADAAPEKDFNVPQFSLFASDQHTGEITQLTEEKWSEIGKLAWMPDGSGMVFVASRPRVGNQIYFLSYPAGQISSITDELNSYSNYGMGVSGDGTILVADLWESTAQLWAVDAKGATYQAEQLTNGISDGAVGLTTLSDGRVIYTSRTGDDTDLWELSNEQGQREGRPLTSDAFFEREVCSGTNSDLLIFSSDRAGKSHLFRMNADGTNIRQLTFGDSDETAPDCSRDGSFVVYSSNSSVWKISTEGGDSVRLADFDCAAPSISPDGNLIACIRRSGFQIKNSTLTVIPVSGGEAIRTFDVIPFAFYYRPVRWTLDSSALVFKKTDNLIGNLWRQDLAGGDPKQITSFKSDVIFNHVFSQDGKTLIISRGKFAVNPVMFRNFRPPSALLPHG